TGVAFRRATATGVAGFPGSAAAAGPVAEGDRDGAVAVATPATAGAGAVAAALELVPGPGRMGSIPLPLARPTNPVPRAARRTPRRTPTSVRMRTPSPSTRSSVRRGLLTIRRIDIYGKPGETGKKPLR